MSQDLPEATSHNKDDTIFLERPVASLGAVILGAGGIAALVIGSFVAVYLGLHLAVIAALVYGTAVLFHFWITRPDKGGMSRGELVEMVTWPYARVRKRKGNDQADEKLSSSMNKSAATVVMVSQKAARNIAYVATGFMSCALFAYATFEGLHEVKIIVSEIIVLVLCVYTVGFAIQYLLLQVWENGLTIGGLRAVLFWPRFITVRLRKKRNGG